MKDSLEKGRKFCVGEEWFGRNDMGYRDETKVVQIGKRQIGGGNPILIQSMCNTKTEADSGAGARGLRYYPCGSADNGGGGCPDGD